MQSRCNSTLFLLTPWVKEFERSGALARYNISSHGLSSHPRPQQASAPAFGGVSRDVRAMVRHGTVSWQPNCCERTASCLRQNRRGARSGRANRDQAAWRHPQGPPSVPAGPERRASGQLERGISRLQRSFAGISRRQNHKAATRVRKIRFGERLEWAGRKRSPQRAKRSGPGKPGSGATT